MAKRRTKVFPKDIIVAWEGDGEGGQFLIVAPYNDTDQLAIEGEDRVVAVYRREDRTRILRNRTEVMPASGTPAT